MHGSQFCDIAVTRNGTVFVAWRQFEFSPGQSTVQDDALAWVKSTDGGRSFTKPAVAKTFTHWDLTDHFGAPAAAGQALYDACGAADYTVGACLSGPEPRQDARNCGDGALACESGYVFARAATQVRITADPNGGPATADDAYVVYDASVPGSQTPTGTTFGTIESGTGSQASIFFIKTTDGGTTWTGGSGAASASRKDPQAVGHQFFPDIDAHAGELGIVWQDNRGPTYNVQYPIGNTRDAQGRAISAGTAIVNTRMAAWTGSDFGPSIKVSSQAHQSQYEMFAARSVPFHGDYNWISLAERNDGSVVGYMTWTDNRNVVPGSDPRELEEQDGFNDGFDVLQCLIDLADPPEAVNPALPRARADAPWTGTNCANGGGLNQDIYGTSVVFD